MDNLYRTHDIFMFPTFRDTFGMVLIEAISFGMPIIATDQYAVTEMAVPGYNAFVFPNHPLLDYNTETKEMYGNLYDAKTLYLALFSAEQSGAMKPLEQFISDSIEQFIKDPNLLEKLSLHSLALYNSTFHEDIISQKIENVFSQAIQQ